MSEEELSKLIDQYDEIVILLENLRIIASGGSTFIEEYGPSINRLLKKEKQFLLSARFNDICSALIWIRDDLMQCFPRPNPEQTSSDLPATLYHLHLTKAICAEGRTVGRHVLMPPQFSPEPA